MKYNYKSVVFPPLWHSQMELEKNSKQNNILKQGPKVNS